MNIEQKNRLIALCDSMKSYGYTDGVEELKSIFPELRESEDERIREEMLDYFKDKKERLHYLCFECGDVRNAPFSEAKQIDDFLVYLEKLKEQKPAEWDMEDERHRIMSGLYLESFADHFDSEAATLVNECVKWLNTLPKTQYIQSERPAEWSENDETFVKDAIEAVENYYSKGCGQEELVTWLKSLRPSWKPSEEQMAALFSCFEESGQLAPDEEGLRSLYSDLEKYYNVHRY